MDGFYEGLQKHLWKSELEYRAKMLPKGCEVDWLAPYCDNVKSIAAFLRSIGFKIKEIVDEEDASGERFQWVKTTSGVIVYTKQASGVGGFVAQAYRKKGV